MTRPAQPPKPPRPVLPPLPRERRDLSPSERGTLPVTLGTPLDFGEM